MHSFQDYLNITEEIGVVEQSASFLAYVRGLPTIRPDEVVFFENGEWGIALSLDEDLVEILLFSTAVQVGTRVVRTREPFTIPVGEHLRGHVLTALCDPLDPLVSLQHTSERYPIDHTPEDIMQRKTIKKPLETGITVVDLLVPLGRGQRELIIGDRKTGKTNFLLLTMLTQAKKGTICIYAGIAKKRMDVKRIEQFFKDHGVMENIIIVTASPQDANALIYFTPFTAITIAEYFKNQGKETLVVLDDLSTHAKFCREISLLARRFPGRDSYPVDIFYTHAKLLERAGNFKTEKGETAITALPVAETNRGELGGYIQTNLMSMTDGHIYFDADIFTKGRRPAVNPFLSVTRVGHQAQLPLKRQLSRDVLAFLTLYERIQTFIHFGAELNQTTRQTLHTGEQLFTLFNQRQQQIVPSNVQLFLYVLIWLDLLHDQSQEQLVKTIHGIEDLYDKDEHIRKSIDSLIEKAGTINDLLKNIQEAKELLQTLW